MKKSNIILMYAISFLQGMVFYGPIATLYRQAQGVTVLQITVIESISLILCLLLEVPWGVIADKIGYKNTMVFCCTLYFVSKIVFWRAESFGAFLAERIMLSVIIAGMSGVDTSILYLSCRKEDSQRIFGVYNALSTAGLLLAAVIFSAAIGGDYKLAGFLTVISYGIAAALSLGLTEVAPDARRRFSVREFKTLAKSLFKDRSMLMFLVGAAFLAEAHQTITVFLNQLKYTQCGITDKVIGYIYIGVTIVGMCGVLSSRITKKMGDKAGGQLMYIAAIIACIVLAVTLSPVVSVAGIALFRISNSLFQPLQLRLQNDAVITGNHATELSINAMIIDGVGAGTNIAFGAIAEKSLTASLLFGAVLCAAGCVMFAVYMKTQRV